MNIGDVYREEREDGTVHLMRCVPDDQGKVKCLVKDLGILDRNGCLPCPWDDTQYPRIDVWNFCVWKVTGSYGLLRMTAMGMSREEAINRWNQRLH